MRIVNWNVEWMNHWFTGNDSPDWGSRSLGADEARSVARRVAAVISATRPDLLCLQEGPSAMAEMRLFTDEFLAGDDGTPLFEALIGRDGGAQKLYVLRRINGRAAAVMPADDPATRALDDVWEADVNGDMLLENYDFTRLPLVVDVDPVGAPPIRVVVLHTKSKYVHLGQEMFLDPLRRQAFVVQALEARRRISAEGFRLRDYLDTLMQAEPGARIVVCGDFNDGPGPDFFERRYLTHNVTDILLGSTFYPDLVFHHPLVARVQAAALFTARFDDFVDGVADRPLLLDHIVVSPALKDHVRDAGIAHDAWASEVRDDGIARVDRPSDHRPVWVELGAPLSG